MIKNVIMQINSLLDEIETDIRDIKSQIFDYNSTNDVPSVKDGSLTFESGEAKYGKIINTCVLFVDIRNSVELNRKHQTQTMGRIYTAFVKSVLRIAKCHKGKVRNIIGDRVMVVFPSKNCFTNAVDCAISINHSQKVMNKVFSNVDIKYGIGIDYGEMKVVKVGLRRQGTENSDNKNLVWGGYPANIASRLTDVANKGVEMVAVNYYPYNHRYFFPHFNPFSNSSLIEKEDNMFLDNPTTKIQTLEEFGKLIDYSNVSGITYSKGKLINFKKFNVKYKSILMTESVYNGFKSENPDRKSIKESFWEQKQNHNIKNVTSSIYEGNIIWEI